MILCNKLVGKSTRKNGVVAWFWCGYKVGHKGKCAPPPRFAKDVRKDG